MDKEVSKTIMHSKGIENVIYFIRGQKVILDEDLAVLYGVSTKRFNEQIRRNIDRFPEDFAFQLIGEEWATLRSQIATSNTKRGGRRYIPFVFTEHGVVMAANVLRSERAIEVSVEIVRTFIQMRHFLNSQKEVIKDLTEIKSYMLKNSLKTDREFKRVWQAIDRLSELPKEEERRIGFDLTPASR